MALGRVEIWLSYDNEKERLQLPVNPESINVTSPFGFNTVEISQLGEATIFGNRGLKEISFSSFFPMEYNPTYCSYANFKDRWLMVQTLERWRDFKRPIRLNITGTRINYPVTIADFSYEAERAGHVGDIYYSLTLKEYRFLDLRVEQTLTKPKEAVKTKEKRPPAPKPPAKANKTYTVKGGDTLQRISKQQYGTVDKWRDIYNANIKTIGKNPNLIKPGQKLVIP